MAADFDYCIIGGGVVGLASAWCLSQHGSVLLLEKNALFGAETSSRNSEVIHAGLYYPPGSLKEQLCLRGKALLYSFCETYDVPHKAIGKLIVAPDEHNPRLTQLFTKGQQLGIPLQRLDRRALQQMEPEVDAQAALFSPSTGIVDSHALMQTLAAQAERHGALLQRHTRFLNARPEQGMWRIHTETSDGPFSLSAATLINCAGLHAQAVATRIEPVVAPLAQLRPCRGHYFSFPGAAPFSHLIYPLPPENLTGLGIHATLDLGGQVRFGPDTQYLDKDCIDDYHVSSALKKTFAQAIQRYFPALDTDRLHPDYAGIRPKLHGADQPAADFDIRRSHDSPPAIQMFGIESPGLTSSLAIGERLTEMIQRH